MQSSNFQQFVSSNKGNLITFKHQGATVSKYVVDVCSEYFTAKGRLTDAKIDGFYYFAECEMYNRSLIETLAYHKYVVLIGEKSPMPDAFFEYQYFKVVSDALMVMGKQLSVANPDVGYTASYIGEVWAIVEGKYTQVWKKVGGVIRHEEDEKMDKIREKATEGSFERSTTGASDPEEEIKKQKVQWYKENADDWIDLCGKNGTFKADKFIYVLGKIKTEPYSEELYKELCSSYEGLRDYIIRSFNENYFGKNNPRVQALAKRFLVLTNEFREKFRNKDVRRLIDLINAKMSIEGENEYERMFGKKKNVSGASGPVKIEDKPVNIEYRGKAKTVEIMNEYTHKNGKEYVWVKDLTDNGKTKTLFKEYIKYM